MVIFIDSPVYICTYVLWIFEPSNLQIYIQSRYLISRPILFYYNVTKYRTETPNVLRQGDSYYNN